MNWSSVRLIFLREVRDQLRDRRTLFMIAVLPILLYPLMGLSFFQVSQFVREQPTKVFIAGAREVTGDEELPPLITNGRFAEYLFDGDPTRTRLLELEFNPPEDTEVDLLPGGEITEEQAIEWVRQGVFEVVVIFPPDFANQLEEYRQQLRELREGGDQDEGAADLMVRVPGPSIYHNSANETSQIAYLRISQVLQRWTEMIGQSNLQFSGVPETAADPVDVANVDVADSDHKDAAIWSKIFPFMVLLWAMTGAFYPAVDLCAGEKERGTLETLLSSPASRVEIVWGKLLTITLFSMATAVLNLISVALTGLFLLRQLNTFAMPPALTPLWLLLVLIPVSALFSALCLALAAMARSTKEGQYYLMPLMMVTMPLVILPMAPGVELSLGNSLIPITGVMLLLRALLEGNYVVALPYVAPVVLVTIGCCLLAIRWAVDQFNSENVLFRESERLDLGLWLKHLVRDRGDTPSVAEALFCCILILMIRVFMGLALAQPHDFRGFVVLAAVTQLVVIATPVLLMTTMLTRKPLRTLLLDRRPPAWSFVAVVVLAVAIHPVVTALRNLVMYLYPLSEEVAAQLNDLGGMMGGPMTGQRLMLLLLVMAIVPAICEELAFRGFVLSGLRHMGHKWQAIVVSAFFFGVTHAIFQQSIVACFLGVLLGFIAVQTGSLIPCVLYHGLHNSLALLSSQILSETASDPAWRFVVSQTEDGGLTYHWSVVTLGAVVSAAILAWMSSKPHPMSTEETLQDAIDHSSPQPSVG